MPRFSLHAIGQDRPGIVAALTGALAAIGCGLEDARMTILHGQFAVMLVVDAPTQDGGAIERALDHAVEELNLFVAVRPLPDSVPTAPAAARANLVVAGRPTSAAIAALTAVAADHGANVVELVARTATGEEGLVVQLEFAHPGALEALSSALPELGIDCKLEPVG